MPELPEVETTVKGLKREVLNRTFLGLWTDTPKIFHNINPEDFEQSIKGKKIIDVKRRAKNILIYLSDNSVILIHLKMTGHLLVGEWEYAKKEKRWNPLTVGPITDDPYNRFLRVFFCLDDKRKIGLCDARKFAKIELWNQEDIKNKVFADIGPEPLDNNFSLSDFINLFKKKRKGKIKQILMDQSFIAGIGNIYASEILFEANIHPEEDITMLNEKNIEKIYFSIKDILPKGIDAGGDSFSDYRNIYGEKGKFQNIMKVYGREGKECLICGNIIKKIIIATRGTFYCPNCQKKK
ncbi:MAG: bifunctional DNA-formamidopyrimidine glycosylase/DNA-(apurinic or apyrimidinic site) lyase [Candidatus Pacebacteria bacterium]|nr:bifunctional DNA-formamidopyrimidine glycosylase/DNA-(apurinic or apyrimidinic site) lyase [Candidatus Paceibacterota bacterium]